MKAITDAPKNFAQWYSNLDQLGQCQYYSEKIARHLRLLSSAKVNTVIMISESQLLPYAPWARDGMSMNSRLIIHQSSTSEELHAATGKQLAADIRVVSHIQPLESFVEDIVEHRFDIIAIQVSSAHDRQIPLWSELLNEGAVLMLLGDSPVLEEIALMHCSEWFSSLLSDDHTNALFMTKKGPQHRQTRSRRRTR